MDQILTSELLQRVRSANGFFDFPVSPNDWLARSKSKLSRDGPSVEINISCSSVVVLSLFRGHGLILFIAENALLQSAVAMGRRSPQTRIRDIIGNSSLLSGEDKRNSARSLD